MEENVSHSVSYYLAVSKSNFDSLASLRKWSELSVAYDSDLIWITNFSLAQMESNEVKMLLDKTIYYSQSGKLYKLNSLLPDRNEPSLLWTPIQRAFSLSISNFNFNYFGLNQEFTVNLIPQEEEQNVFAMLVSLDVLKTYLESAPAIRTKNLHWVIINKSEAFIIGLPLLPLDGTTYWNVSNLILPTGLNFELPLLASEIDKKINPDQEDYIIWNADNTFFRIPKDAFNNLTLSSFRKTLLNFADGI